MGFKQKILLFSIFCHNILYHMHDRLAKRTIKNFNPEPSKFKIQKCPETRALQRRHSRQHNSTASSTSLHCTVCLRFAKPSFSPSPENVRFSSFGSKISAMPGSIFLHPAPN